jgi:hypothetical protein
VSEDLAGEISFLPGSSLAEWRSLLSLSYGWRNASVTARSRYIDSMGDTFVPEYRVPERRRRVLNDSVRRAHAGQYLL